MKQAPKSIPELSDSPTSDSDSYVFTAPLPRVNTLKPSCSATSTATLPACATPSASSTSANALSTNKTPPLSLLSSPSPPSSSASAPYSRKRKTASQLSEFQNRILESISTTNTNIPQSAPAVNDIFSRFGQDIAEQLRDLPDERQKHNIMREVRDILYKARFDDYGSEPSYYNFN